MPSLQEPPITPVVPPPHPEDSAARVRLATRGGVRLGPVWRSPLRGPWLTSILGTLLIPAFTVMAVTGFISHWLYQPGLAGNATTDPAFDIPVLFTFPSSWPSWDVAVNQGIHVTLGLMLVPVLLAKLWSVMPKLFVRPTLGSLARALERLSILLLVATVLVEVATGIVMVDGTSLPLVSDWFAVHYYGAWIFIVMFVVHGGVKFPTVRRAYRERGAWAPLRERLADTRPEPPDPGGLVSVTPSAPSITRRGLLAMIGGSSLAVLGVQVGTSTGGVLRRLALLAPRGQSLGSGPNGFPVTTTAAGARIATQQAGADWRLVLRGAARPVALSRDELLAMPQAIRVLTLTCTEGWSTTQTWAGVRLADLARLAGAPEAAVLRVSTLQAAYGTKSYAHAQFSDNRALLALRVNGADLSPDHGYPARVILPGVPGVHNAKWVRELAFEAI